MKTFKESQTKTLLIFQNCDQQKHFLTPLSDSAHNTTRVENNFSRTFV